MMITYHSHNMTFAVAAAPLLSQAVRTGISWTQARKTQAVKEMISPFSGMFDPVSQIFGPQKRAANLWKMLRDLAVTDEPAYGRPDCCIDYDRKT